MYKRIPSRNQELVALGIACLAALFFFSSAIAPNLTRLTHGFISYYTIARLAREGQADARIYDDTWYRAETVRVSGGTADDIFRPNLPTAMFLFTPLTIFPVETARALWTLLNLVLLGGTFVVLTRVSGVSRTRALGLGAFFLVAAPVGENFRFGQAYVVLLFLFALSLYLWQREQNFASGVLLGIAAILKTAGAFLWLMFLARREWRILLGGGGILVIGILLSLPFVGMEPWRVYLFQVLPALANNPEQALTAHQTLSGFLQHLLRYDIRLNPFPLWDAPWLVRALYIGLGVLVLGTSLYRTRAQAKANAFAVFLTCSVLFAPAAEEYHFVLLILPAFVLAVTIQKPYKTFLIFLVALALVALPFPYKAPQLAVGWYALLAYPCLYGALLLWGLLVFKK